MPHVCILEFHYYTLSCQHFQDILCQEFYIKIITININLLSGKFIANFLNIIAVDHA